RRPTASIRRPATPSANVSDEPSRSVRGHSTVASVIVAPTISPRRSRATVSTSGSSGIEGSRFAGDHARTARGPEQHLELPQADQLLRDGPPRQLPVDAPVENVEAHPRFGWSLPAPPLVSTDALTDPAEEFQ